MKRSLVVLLATSLVLVGCGNDSSSSTDTKSPKTTETKQQKAEQAVLDVYQTYEKTLGQSGRADAKDLASIEYTGDEKQLEPLAVGAKNLNVVPGKVVKSFQKGDVAYIIHEFKDAKGSILPNRGSKLLLKKDDEWKIVLTPTTFDPS
ncbi:MAG: hypothetical protein ACOVQU_01890, partial [Exiguobacterium acetylicum]